MYTIILRNLPQSERRALYELVEDVAAVAALDRETMGQTSTVEVADIPVRR